LQKQLQNRQPTAYTGGNLQVSRCFSTTEGGVRE
jgi:hypothetical protein